MTIGNRIKALREKNGITQTELAELIGTTKQNIYKYENGIITNIPSDKIELIAQHLSVSPAYLMGWEEDNTPAEPKKEEGTELTANEREMIDIFKGLTPTQQGKLIERAKIMSEDNETEATAKENAS